MGHLNIGKYGGGGDSFEGIERFSRPGNKDSSPLRKEGMVKGYVKVINSKETNAINQLSKGVMKDSNKAPPLPPRPIPKNTTKELPRSISENATEELRQKRGDDLQKLKEKRRIEEEARVEEEGDAKAAKALAKQEADKQLKESRAKQEGLTPQAPLLPPRPPSKQQQRIGPPPPLSPSRSSQRPPLPKTRPRLD